MSVAMPLVKGLERRRRYLRFVHWAVHLPAVAGSVGVLLVLLTFLGRWEPNAILGWFALGLALLTRTGERASVRAGCGFRRPSEAQMDILQPSWRDALARACLGLDEVKLFVRRDPVPNAYAVGAGSVAVTAGLVQEFLAQRLRREHVSAILLHELGHLQAGHVRAALATAWFEMPWRTGSRALLALSSRLAGRRVFTATLAMLTAGVATATVRAVRDHEWSVAATLVALVLGVLCSFSGAALCRHAEFAADRFAAAAGRGSALAEALTQAARQRSDRGGMARLTARHPPLTRRAQRMLRR